jgi:hypothetical protein
LSSRSFANELIERWYKTTDIVDGQLERLGPHMSKPLYHILGMIHLALVSDAGLLIVIFAPLLFSAQFMVQEPNISLVFLLGYVVCDLVRLPFRHGATISLGFPLIFLTLLADSPFAALRNATLGSMVSEALHSIFASKQRHPWSAALRRALFYAGHHAVAGLGALIAYQLTYGRFFPQLLNTIGVDILAILAYVIVYSLISMLLVCPHDRRIRLFLTPNEEPFVRIHFLTTLLLLPLPASAFHLYNLNLGQIEKTLIVAGVLPPLFVLLFYLARNFTKVEEERLQLALREEIGELLGSPYSIAEMAERMLTIMGELVDHRWGAAYSLVDEELVLCGVKPAKGALKTQDLFETEQTWWPSLELGKDKGQVAWPMRVKPGEGILGKMVKGYLPPQFFDQGREAITPSEPYLPRKTALAVCPITTWTQGEAEQVFLQPIGMIAVARPRRMFTTWEWEKGQALSSKTSNVLLNVQRLEKAMREIYQRVEDYATDPERVCQAVHELIQRRVDVSRYLAIVSERSFQGSLRAVLRSVVEGRRGDGISLDAGTLMGIYNQVRDQTPGMPSLDDDIFQLLQTVTSSLSLAFSFPYQFPDVERGSTFKEFYEFLLVALDANIVSRIMALDPQIKDTVKAIRSGRRAMYETPEGRAANLVALPSEALEEVENLQAVVQLLKDQDQTQDLARQEAALDQALRLVAEREEAVRRRLRDPERFVFLQILSSWRGAINNTLEDLKHGPAHLQVSLRSQQALQLLEETIAGLVLQNQGPGVASSVIAQLEPSPDYEVLTDKIDIGALIAGKTEELDFALRPKGKGPLRLHFRVTYNDPERKGKVKELGDLLYLLEPPPFADIPNPYTPGMPLKPGNPTFFGRDDIFNFIRQNAPALERKTILVLIGERRTGKTSILQQLPARLKDPRSIPVYIDGQQLGIDAGMSSFFLSLTVAIADGLAAAGIIVPHLTPEQLRENPQYIFEQQYLPLVRERIGGRVLLLTIDEFEELGARVKRGLLPPEIFPYLRHLIQHGEQLAFIFAGTHKVEQLMGDYWSVLFNIAEYRKVSFLKREEAVRLITEPVRSFGMVYDNLAINEILSLTACNPYFTQLLCNLLVNRCNEAERSYVTVQDVRDTVEELLETGRAHLTFLWQTSDREAKLTLAALAELRDQLDQITTAAITDQVSKYQRRLDPSQIMGTMEQLSARDIVREMPGSPVSYDFTAQLYAHWLRRYKPLSKVAEEVSSEPILEEAPCAEEVSSQPVSEGALTNAE